MAVDSKAELMLKKLLIHNKLLTENQWKRVVEKTAGKSTKTMPEELKDRRFVKPSHIDKVMAAQSDLVEVVHRLRQVVCVKG